MFKVPKISFSNFRIEIKLLEDGLFPEYKGSMFRGAFGNIFRKVLCVTSKPTCDSCILSNQCQYFQIFETEITDTNLWFLKGVKKTPHPFVIHPPAEERRNYKKGEKINVWLTIFGKYTDYLPYFIITFEKMGETGISFRKTKFKLENVFYENPDKSETLVYSGKTKIFNKIDFDSGNDRLNNILRKRPSKINLIFKTPLRIQHEGKLIVNQKELTPELLLKIIERRIFIIANLFCGFKTPPESQIPENITDLRFRSNLTFYSWERYSSRQKAKIALSGLIGKIEVEGSIKKYLPYFLLGAELNIGKNTVFGLGKYEVII